MQGYRRGGQAAVTFKRVFNFLLCRRVNLPGGQALLKHFCPGAVKVHLFARALVDNFKPISSHVRDDWWRGRCFRCVGMNFSPPQKILNRKAFALRFSLLRFERLLSFEIATAVPTSRLTGLLRFNNGISSQAFADFR